MLETVLSMPLQKTIRDEDYRKWVETQDCLRCGVEASWQDGGRNHAHHWSRWTDKGTGKKPSDIYCIPLCYRCHRWIHDKGEMAFLRESWTNNIFETMLLQLMRYKHGDIGADTVRQAYENV